MSASMELRPDRAMIGSWSVDRYINQLRWPVFVGMAVLLLLTVTGRSLTVITSVEALLVIGIAYLVSRRGAQRVEGLFAGALIGLGFGLMTSIGKFGLDPQLIAAINIVAETLWATIAASFITASVIIIRQLFTR